MNSISFIAKTGEAVKFLLHSELVNLLDFVGRTTYNFQDGDQVDIFNLAAQSLNKVLNFSGLVGKVWGWECQMLLCGFMLICWVH